MRRPLPAALAAPIVALVALATPAAGTPAAGSPAGPPEWRTKVAPALLAQAETQAEVEVLLRVGPRIDLAPARALPDKVSRGRWVTATLREAASQAQAPLLAELADRGIPHRSLWIAGLVWARMPAAELAAIAGRPEVRSVDANPRVALRLPPEDGVFAESSEASTNCPPNDVTWGIERIGALAYWAAGFDGQGVTVAGQDTGYDFDHPALRDAYRGFDGVSWSHDYNWYDAIHSVPPPPASPNPCGVDSLTPCDDHGHGTHTMGTMVGYEDHPSGPDQAIGVAPGARWIGCRNMDRGDGTPASYIECFQFFLAPTDVLGNDPDPTLAPDVINNAWGGPTSEGCTGQHILDLQAAADAVRAAGIAIIASAGNAGSGCGTVNTPPATFDASFAVGATGVSNAIASFSSRGPGPAGGGFKPDVVAPGVSVCSATRNSTGYHFSSGTSMASPHVAGLVALMLSLDPCLRGDVDRIEALLRQRALPLADTATCGGVPGTAIPNHTYGHGLVQGQVPGCYAAGNRLFCNGFEDGETTAWCGDDPLLRGPARALPTQRQRP